jgi:hypothetical protein
MIGFNKLRFLLKQNMILHLEHELIKDGNFQNIVSGLQLYEGSDMSRLIRDESQEVAAELGLYDTGAGSLEIGKVYQSAFRNWVYESGVQLNSYLAGLNWPSPIRASGVYVDGRFCPTDPNDPAFDPSCSHKIDYINGRVIFDSIMPQTAVVHADFAFKEVFVTTASKFNNQLVNGVLETKFTTNPRTSSQLIYPSGSSKIMPYPIVFIEDRSRDFDAYQLGDRSLIVNDEMVYHIYALDESTRDNLIDLISFDERKRIPLIDFNVAPIPLSGIENTLSPEYIPYQEMLQLNNVVTTVQRVVSACSPSGVITTTVVATQRAIGYLADISRTTVEDLGSFKDEQSAEVFERAVVSNITSVYAIAPTAPLGFALSPVFPSGCTGSL